MVYTLGPGEAWSPEEVVENHVQKDASNVEQKSIGLPESLYWEYVRPFTPIKDRVVVSKRCSTRYYAGERIDLDESYLKTLLERRRGMVSMGAEVCVYGDTSLCYDVPIARGVPGTHNFCIDFQGFNLDDMDPAEVLKMLRRARSAWDEHLYQIPSPSARLYACLNVLHVNGSCQTSAVSSGQNVYPNTQLGYWIGRYLSSIMMGFRVDDIIHRYSSGSNHLGSIVNELLDAGANVGPFFEPLDAFPQYKFSALTVMSRYAPNFFKRGMSMFEVMEKYSCWLSYQCDFARGNQISRLLDQIQAKLDHVIVYHRAWGSDWLFL